MVQDRDGRTSSGGRLISDWESRGQGHSPPSLYFFLPEKKMGGGAN